MSQEVRQPDPTDIRAQASDYARPEDRPLFAPRSPSSLPKGNWSENVLTIDADLDHLIIVRDGNERLVCSGRGNAKLQALPGIYTVELRRKGRSEKHLVVKQPSSTAQKLPRIFEYDRTFPAPEPSRPLADRKPWNEQVGNILDKEIPMWPFFRNGLVIVLADYRWLENPASHGDRKLAISGKVRSIENPKEPKDDSTESSGVWVLRGTSRPPFTHLEYEIPGVGKRAQAVPVEAGWVTVVAFASVEHVHLAESAVLVMVRNSLVVRNRGIRISEFLQETGIALDALSVGQIGVTPHEAEQLKRGNIAEPIRALATCYVSLHKCTEIADAAQTQNDAKEAFARCKDALNEVKSLAKRLVGLLPHSPDARLVGVYATFLQEVLQRRAEGKTKDVDVVQLRNGFTPVPSNVALWLRLAAFGLPGFFLLVLMINSISKSDYYGGQNSALWGVGFVMCAILGYTAWFIQSRRPFFDEPPVFDEGMTLLLRLAVLYTEICTSDSHIVDVALRKTTGSIWTRWQANLTPKVARKRFADALASLESAITDADRQGEDIPGISKNQRAAARHLAASLLLPLSFTLSALKSKGNWLANYLLRTSSGNLYAYFRDRLNVDVSPKVSPSGIPLSRFILFLIIPGILLTIGVPNFVKARESAGSHKSPIVSCIVNLKQIEMAKQQWAMDYKKSDNTVPKWEDLVGKDKYLSSMPVCPSGGTYTLGAVDEHPKCSIPGHSL